MERNSQHLITKIARLREAVKRKYKKFKQGILESEVQLEKQYEPLLSELRKPNSLKNDNIKKEEEEQVFEPAAHSSPNKTIRTPGGFHQSYVPFGGKNEETFETSDRDPNLTAVLSTHEGQESASRFVRENFTHPTARKYMMKLMKDAGGSKNTIDHTFGPYFKNDVLMVGNEPLQFEDDGSIVVAGVKYRGTNGLYELLFKRLPDDEVYTQDDLDAYKDILVKTSAHKRQYNYKGTINRDNSIKYKNIIANLFPKQLYGGKGVVSKSLSVPDRIYWDNVNELVDRLRLLVVSAETGNKSHKNEILSIKEELTEAGIIKGGDNLRFRALLK